ncbi:MAG: sulfotransferase domain-containing protein [Micropruina sp.]|uniref:sulfotransferase domain-containing protein n=1 Tax=Micropruina sp. TaxID=2737536 RepID=UPI0039E3BAED
MAVTRHVYEEGSTDSSRWSAIKLRTDDVIISTPSKCGTTWVQMICALLIFGTELPGRLTELSPWVDMRLRPLADLQSRLSAQQHRRFLKTHTPLDGLPTLDGVTYIVAGRDPRDVAVSMDRHRANLDNSVIAARMPPNSEQRPAPQPGSSSAPITQRERILNWINDDAPPSRRLSSLRGMAWHLSGVPGNAAPSPTWCCCTMPI